jgi:hypothetical protein
MKWPVTVFQQAHDCLHSPVFACCPDGFIFGAIVHENNRVPAHLNWHGDCYLDCMSILSRDGGSGRELVTTGALSDADRAEMRGWIREISAMWKSGSARWRKSAPMTSFDMAVWRVGL